MTVTLSVRSWLPCRLGLGPWQLGRDHRTVCNLEGNLKTPPVWQWTVNPWVGLAPAMEPPCDPDVNDVPLASRVVACPSHWDTELEWLAVQVTLLPVPLRRYQVSTGTSMCMLPSMTGRGCAATEAATWVSMTSCLSDSEHSLPILEHRSRLRSQA